MKRITLTMAALIYLAVGVQAHFVYIVPTESGKSIKVVFSDDLSPDKSVPITKVAGTKLTLRVAGQDRPLPTEKVENYLAAETAGPGTRIVYGHTDYGVVQKGQGKPFRLHYYPKAVLGDAFAKEAVVGKEALMEIVPVREGARVKFLVLFGAKPLPQSEVFLRKPGAKSPDTIKTDETGHTEGYAEPGRYALVARKLDSVTGEHGGKRYEEERHYATLVIDLPLQK